MPDMDGCGFMRSWRGAVALGCLVLGALFTSGGVLAGDPRGAVEQTAERLLTAVREARATGRTDATESERLVREIVLPQVDFERMSRWVLGKHWREATPEQRAHFQTAFLDILIRTYAAALPEYHAVRVEYVSTRQEADSPRAQSRTLIHRPEGNPIHVDYTVEQSDGRWRVVDVVIEGVSMVTTYRQSFARVIAEKGLEGLIASLDEHVRGTGDVIAAP